MEKEKKRSAELNGRSAKRVSVAAGVIAGAIADGYLRMVSGDEGNLLVHSAVFLIGAAAVAGAVYGILRLKRRTAHIGK